MRHKPFIVERPLIENNAQFIACDLKDVFQLVRETERIPYVRPVFCIHKMKGDKSRLILRQLHADPFFDQLQGISSEVKLMRIKPFDLPQQRILEVDPCSNRSIAKLI